MHPHCRPRRSSPSATAAFAVLLGLGGCHDGGSGPGADLLAAGDLASGDLPPLPDLTSTGDGPAFCGDPQAARVELNGARVDAPATSGKALILDCCDAATLSVTSAQLATPLFVQWRLQAGLNGDLPATVDLANLPQGWTVSLLSGCSPAEPNCQPTDRYNDGLTGTLTVKRSGSGYQMTTCLQAVEPAQAPHPVIHALRLWAPAVSAP